MEDSTVGWCLKALMAALWKSQGPAPPRGEQDRNIQQVETERGPNDEGGGKDGERTKVISQPLKWLL